MPLVAESYGGATGAAYYAVAVVDKAFCDAPRPRGKTALQDLKVGLGGWSVWGQERPTQSLPLTHAPCRRSASGKACAPAGHRATVSFSDPSLPRLPPRRSSLPPSLPGCQVVPHGLPPDRRLDTARRLPAVTGGPQHPQAAARAVKPARAASHQRWPSAGRLQLLPLARRADARRGAASRSNEL